MTGRQLLTIYEIVTTIVCAFLPFLFFYSLLKKKVDDDKSSFYKLAFWLQMAALGALTIVVSINYGVLGFSIVLLPICSLMTYVFGFRLGNEKKFKKKNGNSF